MYAFVASGRRVGRPARRRRAHPGAQLALDLLHQHPDRHRHGRDGPAAARARSRASASARAPTFPGAVLITELAHARRLHDRRAGGRPRLGLRQPRSACGAGSLALLAAVPRPRAPRGRTRSCRCGSSARATSSARTCVQIAVGARACSGCSSSARSTCERVLGLRRRCRSASRSCPSTIVMGTLSLRYSERLVMRFGARRTLIPGLVLIARRRSSSSASRRSTASYWTDVLPGDGPARAAAPAWHSRRS